MITTSELAVTITIWVLAANGAFFGLRAYLKRKKARRVDQPKPPGSS